MKFDRKFVQKIKKLAEVFPKTSASFLYISREELKLFRLLSDISQNTTVYVKHMTVYEI